MTSRWSTPWSTGWSTSSLARRAAVVGGLYVALVLGAYRASIQAPGHRVLPYLAVHFTATAVMLGAWAWLRRAPRGDDHARAVASLVGFGVVARFALATAAPFTTTDVERYLWDGAVALHGQDPYVLAPDAPALAGLRAVFPVPLDHMNVATCYPPLAVGLFALAAVWGGARALTVWKLLVACASSAVALASWRHLREGDRAADTVLVALSPLLVLESGVGGHLDAFGALAVVAAVASAERGRWDRAALAVGIAGAVKFVPGMVAVPLVLRAPARVRFTLLAALPLALSMATARGLGMTPPGTLGTVALNWSFAAPLWSALYHFFPEGDGVIRASLAAAALLGWLVLGLRRRSLARNARDAFAWGLVVSPVLYPWYGMPLAALTAFAPAGWVLALLTALPVSYEVIDGYQATGRWHPHTWPMVTITAVGALGLLVDGLWRLRSPRPARDATARDATARDVTKGGA